MTVKEVMAETVVTETRTSNVIDNEEYDPEAFATRSYEILHGSDRQQSSK